MLRSSRRFGQLRSAASPTCGLLFSWIASYGVTACSGDVGADADAPAANAMADGGRPAAQTPPSTPSGANTSDDASGTTASTNPSPGTTIVSGDPATVNDSTAPGALSNEPPDVFADGTPVTTDPVGTELQSCSAGDAVQPLVKLSTTQYRNTVRDLLALLGVDAVATGVEPRLAAIPEDSRSQLFRGLDTRIALEHVEGYFNVAKTIGDAITSDDVSLASAASSCALDDPLTDTCLDDFIDRVGLLSFRRPLTDAERDEFRATADEASSGRAKLRAVLVAALISPRFVNHVEVDGAPVSGSTDTLRLSPYEVASRISYTFWQSMPDQALLDAAADGGLSTDVGLKGQIDRVFADPRTQETLWTFWREWLSLDGFTGFELGRPGFQSLARGTGVDSNTYAAMVDEVNDLTRHFTFDQPSTLRGLLNTNVSVTRSDTLANLYGVSPWSGSGEFPTFDVGQRAGLFQRAALLVSSLEQTNPFHRGAFVKRYLLCEDLPSPDPAALPPGSLDIPPTSAVQTTRQRFEGKISGNELCTGCHGLFTEVGYTLEAFDSLGRFRTTEQVFDDQSGELLAELPVDATATVRVGTESRVVSSPAELNALMLEAGNVEACLAKQYFRFTERRNVDPSTSDACVAQQIAAAAADEQLGLQGAFRRIAEYKNFYVRKVGGQ